MFEENLGKILLLGIFAILVGLALIARSESLEADKIQKRCFSQKLVTVSYNGELRCAPLATLS